MSRACSLFWSGSQLQPELWRCWAFFEGETMREFLIATICVFALLLSGCAILDSLTGADDPDVVAGTKASTIESVAEGAEAALPFPWSVIAGGVLGYGAKAYRDIRSKQKAEEATA